MPPPQQPNIPPPSQQPDIPAPDPPPPPIENPGDQPLPPITADMSDAGEPCGSMRKILNTGEKVGAHGVLKRSQDRAFCIERFCIYLHFVIPSNG